MLYAVVLSLAVGIAWQTVYPQPVWFWVSIGLIAILSLLGGWRREENNVGGPRALQVGFLLIILVLGAYRVEYAFQALYTNQFHDVRGEEVVLTGVVVAEPDIRNTQQLLTIATGEPETRVLVQTDRHLPIQYGDLIEAVGVLELPTTFTTDLGRTFDYVGHLAAQGITYRMSFAEVAVLDSGHGNPILSALLTFKQSFMAQVATVLPEPAAGLSFGLLLGVKQALGDALETAFRQTGIIHIVVLSGYNVMLVVAFVTTILGYFLPLRSRVVVGLLAITAFALLVGLSATVVRASIMAGLFLIAAVTGRCYQVLRGLFVAAAIMILVNPLIVIYDIGFQLSFMATLGLLLIVPRFETMLMQVPQWLGIRDFFMATVATQIAVSPLLMYHIGEISLVSVPVNMVVLPMVPVAMLTTFIVGMVSYVSSALALVAAYPAYLSLEFIIIIAESVAALPFATVWVPVFSWWWVGLGYGVIGAAVYWWMRHDEDKDKKSVSVLPLPIQANLKETPPEYADWTIQVETNTK